MMDRYAATPRQDLPESDRKSVLEAFQVAAMGKPAVTGVSYLRVSSAVFFTVSDAAALDELREQFEAKLSFVQAQGVHIQ